MARQFTGILRIRPALSAGQNCLQGLCPARQMSSLMKIDGKNEKNIAYTCKKEKKHVYYTYGYCFRALISVSGVKYEKIRKRRAGHGGFDSASGACLCRAGS